MNANQIIDDLGGTSAVAGLCGITTGAVSQWRSSGTGIPKPWIKYFMEIRPDVFDKTKTAERAQPKKAA